MSVRESVSFQNERRVSVHPAQNCLMQPATHCLKQSSSTDQCFRTGVSRSQYNQEFPTVLVSVSLDITRPDAS